MRVVGILVGFSAGLCAQTNARPEFEVASIKPSAPDARGTFIRPSPSGLLNITNMSVQELIMLGWRVQPFQISGGPGWLGSARYDISAKAQTAFKPGDLALLVQSLLEDRFQLVIHKESKDMPIYALVMARKDGRLGAQLVESKEGGCTPIDTSKPPPPPPEPGKPPALGCGAMMLNPRELRG